MPSVFEVDCAPGPRDSGNLPARAWPRIDRAFGVVPRDSGGAAIHERPQARATSMFTSLLLTLDNNGGIV
jgi:hypothetical protein